MDDFYSSSNKKAFEDIFSSTNRKKPRDTRNLSDEEYYRTASTPPSNPDFIEPMRHYEDYDTGRNNYDDEYSDIYTSMRFDDEEELTSPFIEGDEPQRPATPPRAKVTPKNYKNVSSGKKKTPPPKKKKKKKSFGKILVSIILIGAILFCCLFGYVYMLTTKLNHQDNTGHNNPYVSSSELYSNSKVKNILLVGIDKAENDSSRSDTNMLISIDSINKKIKMLSFMRDLWVEIPDNGSAKLNAACAYGGPELTVYTIEKNFGIKIDGYAMVDFDIFISLIDSLGGIDVEVTEAESEFMRTEQGFLDVPAGKSVHLNGKEALLYSRIRYLDSDFMRTKRQRKVITSLINKAKSPNVLKIMGNTSEVLPKITTNIPSMNLTLLGFESVFSYLKYDIIQTQIPFEDTWYYDEFDGQSVIAADMDEQRQLVHDYLYDYSADKFETTTETE